MAINYTGANGLFTRLRVLFDLLESAETYQETTVQSDLTDILAQYSGATASPNEYDYVQRVIRVGRTAQRNFSIRDAVKTVATNEIIKQVQAHDSSVRSNINDAIDVLIAQMITDSQTVLENGVTVTITPPNDQKPQLLVVEHEGLPADSYGIIARETRFEIRGAATSDAPPFGWPPRDFSGTLTYATVDSSLLSNGSFDLDSTIIAGHPEDWALEVGDIGSTVSSTVFSSQRITITGSPTTGWFNLTLTDLAGNIQTTEPIQYNPAAANISAAINALVGFEDATVTSPSANTFDVLFEGIAGTVPLMTRHREFDVGDVTIADTTVGETGGQEAKSLYFTGDGAENTTIAQTLELRPSTRYGFHIRMARSAGVPNGVITVELVDGTNTVINGATMNVNVVDLSVGTFKPFMFNFETPGTMPEVQKFRIRASTAITSGMNIFIDSAILRQVRTLSSRIGLMALAFEGVSEADVADNYVFDVANDYAGRFQTYFTKLYGRQLPSAAAPTIAD